MARACFFKFVAIVAVWLDELDLGVVFTVPKDGALSEQAVGRLKKVKSEHTRLRWSTSLPKRHHRSADEILGAPYSCEAGIGLDGLEEPRQVA